MADLNHVFLIGRLTRDAELKYTANGQAVCKFSLAVGRRRKNGEEWIDETSFFDIVLWGRSGETLNQYLVKGKQVGIDGELRQERWDQEGQARSKVSIVANNVQLLGGGSGGGGGSSHPAPSQGSSYSAPREQQRAPSRPAPQEPQYPVDGPGDDGFTDDIPF